jgi:glycosyltransferase involved in cell wall biosynthesis
MKILIATDAWRPQINGVVRSIEAMVAHLPALGATVEVVGPDRFANWPMPGYSEIRLAPVGWRTMDRLIGEIDPDLVHIATEGPLGWATRRACLKRGRAFSSAYHTRFPEYVASRLPVPERLTYSILRRFHAASGAVMVATQDMRDDLARHGFANLALWSRGVDVDLFRPRPPKSGAYARPVFLYVGRLAVEKQVDRFLALDLPGTRMVVGTGPERERLQAAYPKTVFLGGLEGEALARAYADADVFVFPSRTDTFGMVLLEALASGLPVAAYPVMGPTQIIGTSGCGVLDEDLRMAALSALEIAPQTCRARAMSFSWDESARSFLAAAKAAGSARPG